jgi:hypothetical protein
MSARVSTLLGAGWTSSDSGRHYLFLLIEWNDYAYAVRDELNRQAEAFGLDLGTGGTFVQAYSQRMYDVGREVVSKSWPADIHARFASDQDPIILVVDKEWSLSTRAATHTPSSGSPASTTTQRLSGRC